jgi:hypothetical protein
VSVCPAITALGQIMTGIGTWLKHLARGIAISLPIVVAIGFAMPWPAGENAVLSRHSGQIPITVAFFYHSKSWHSARAHSWVRETSQSRSYILLPSVFTHPGIVTASQNNGDPPVVSEMAVPFWVLAVPGAIALCVLGLWFIGARTAPAGGGELSARQARVIYGDGSFGKRSAGVRSTPRL